MAAQATFRTCPDTGLKVDRQAENLIKVNAVAAVVFLLVGGLLGLLVALTRGRRCTFCRPRCSMRS